MAFILPTFNLAVDVYTGPFIGHGAPRLSVMGNLAYSKRVTEGVVSGLIPSDAIAQVPVKLLLPVGTDVRDASVANPPNSDLVQVPAGSGRWYYVANVDDIGKGFANEHRCAIIFKIYEAIDPPLFPGLLWPTPIP